MRYLQCQCALGLWCGYIVFGGVAFGDNITPAAVKRGMAQIDTAGVPAAKQLGGAATTKPVNLYPIT